MEEKGASKQTGAKNSVPFSVSARVNRFATFVWSSGVVRVWSGCGCKRIRSLLQWVSTEHLKMGEYQTPNYKMSTECRCFMSTEYRYSMSTEYRCFMSTENHYSVSTEYHSSIERRVP